MMTVRTKLLTTLCMATLLSGCGIINLDKPGQPEYAPVDPPKPVIPPVNHGGIYHQDNALALFETIRARRVGDIITVDLDEGANGEKRSQTNGTKDSDISIQNPTLFGQPVSFGGGYNLGQTLNAAREFEGSGDSRQDHRLTGTITVTVYEVLPGGNLRVRGEKWLRINQGDEYIRLTGIVRAADVSGDNRVSSKRIADARITFTGKGQIADNNRAGWAQRFFTHPIWPW